MSEWIKWEGGEFPVPPETLVEVRTITGDCLRGRAYKLCWRLIDPLGNITAYRVVEEGDAVRPRDEDYAQILRGNGWTVIEPPRTITVNGVEVPEPLREAPPAETRIYVTDIARVEGFFFYIAKQHNDSRLERCIERGICHLTKEAAVAHFLALIKPSRRDCK